MTNYPDSLDNIITLPTVSGSTEEDIAINALREATLAIETELGLSPSGVYSDVRARFDILESRINFSVSPSIPNDGYVNSPLILANSGASLTLTISSGTGQPAESRVGGSLYLRGDGYANNDVYVRRGSDWVGLQTDPSITNFSSPSVSPYTVSTEAVVLVQTHSGAFTVNLPVAPQTGTTKVIKDFAGVAAGNIITVASAALIDGSATYLLDANYESVKLLFNGTTWSVIS